MRRFCRRYGLTIRCHGVECRGITMTQSATNANVDGLLGRRIKDARAERKFTIAHIAARMGVDPRTVAGWQSGRSKPSYERLILLAQILDKPPSFFIDEAAA